MRGSERIRNKNKPVRRGRNLLKKPGPVSRTQRAHLQNPLYGAFLILWSSEPGSLFPSCCPRPTLASQWAFLVFTASLPPACSSCCTLLRDLKWSGAGRELGRGARRCVYRFLNVRYQLDVKSEPGDTSFLGGRWGAECERKQGFILFLTLLGKKPPGCLGAE